MARVTPQSLALSIQGRRTAGRMQLARTGVAPAGAAARASVSPCRGSRPSRESPCRELVLPLVVA